MGWMVIELKSAMPVARKVSGGQRYLFKTEAAAKAYRTRQGLAEEQFLVLSEIAWSGLFDKRIYVGTYNDQIRAGATSKMVEKTNAMTGEKFMEDEDTPYYLSPSSETYWSA